MRTSWDWCDYTALQTQDSKFHPWLSEAIHANFLFTEAPLNIEYFRFNEEKTFAFLKPECQRGVKARDRWLSRQAA